MVQPSEWNLAFMRRKAPDGSDLTAQDYARALLKGTYKRQGVSVQLPGGLAGVHMPSAADVSAIADELERRPFGKPNDREAARELRKRSNIAAPMTRLLPSDVSAAPITTVASASASTSELIPAVVEAQVKQNLIAVHTGQGTPQQVMSAPALQMQARSWVGSFNVQMSASQANFLVYGFVLMVMAAAIITYYCLQPGIADAQRVAHEVMGTAEQGAGLLHNAAFLARHGLGRLTGIDAARRSAVIEQLRLRDLATCGYYGCLEVRAEAELMHKLQLQKTLMTTCTRVVEIGSAALAVLVLKDALRARGSIQKLLGPAAKAEPALLEGSS